MSIDDDRLHERLTRLERAMPDALPLDFGGEIALERPRRQVASGWWPASVLLVGAVVAGMLVGGAGLLLLGPRPSGAPVLPSGLYRSATPVDDPVCVSLELPVRPLAEDAAQRRVWWWPRGPEGCQQRADFIYVQWVQPTAARIPAGDGSTSQGVRLQLVAELRDGSRHDLDIVIDPLAEATDDGSVPTWTADGSQPGTLLLPINDYDELEVVEP